FRQLGVLAGTQLGNLFLLAVDVTGVLGLDLDLFGYLVIHSRGLGHFGQGGVVDLRTGQQVEQVVLMSQRRAEACSDGIAQRSTRAYPGVLQTLFFLNDTFALGLESRPALVVDQTQFAALLGQAQVGVVLTQDQPVFGARGEHAVRLLGAQ